MYIEEGLEAMDGGATGCSESRHSETFVWIHHGASAESPDQWPQILLPVRESEKNSIGC